MIKLKDLLLERMTYAQLMAMSDDGRKERANNVTQKRMLLVHPVKNGEAWEFRYKSSPETTTTGLPHRGQITLFEGVGENDDAMQLKCTTDCSCPDYKYRFAYNNKEQDAGLNGPNSLNKSIDRAPIRYARNPGLCKHLLCVRRFLETAIQQPATVSPQQKQADLTKAVDDKENPSNAPDPDKEKELNTQQTPTDTNIDPSLAPQEPTPNINRPPPEKEIPQNQNNIDVNKQENPDNQEELSPEDNNLNKKKLKENTSNICSKLDELCNNKPFVLKYE